MARITSTELKNGHHVLDAIIALGMFKEGANWIWAERAIIIGERNSLTDIVQMSGRTFRDAEGKEHVEIIQLLPNNLRTAVDEEGFREGLNNFLKAIFASLLFENVITPIKLKLNDRIEDGVVDARSPRTDWLGSLGERRAEIIDEVRMSTWVNREEGQDLS